MRPRTTCACGTCRSCVQARYRRSAKGKAAIARYNASQARKATMARYRATANGQRVIAASNARRIFIAGDGYGRVASAALAAQINAHIKERIGVFKQRFADREKAQGATPGQVPTQAAV